MDLSVLVPIYNEAPIIEQTINSLIKELETLGLTYELIIVDDGSKDDVQDKISDIGHDIKYQYYDNGPSRRENLGLALSKADGNIVAYLDSDLATDLRHLRHLFSNIGDFDVVIGSRYLPEATVKRKLYRKSISSIYNAFIRFYFSSKVYDHQCGFKAFRRDSIRNILNEMGYDHKFVRGWFWDAELLIRAQKKGLKIKEIPVDWIAGDKSTFSVKREIKMIPYILGLKFRL